MHKFLRFRQILQYDYKYEDTISSMKRLEANERYFLVLHAIDIQV